MTKCSELRTLLRNARRAASDASPSAIRTAQNDLRDYANDVANPPPKELQDIAVNTIIDLGVASVVDVSDLLDVRENSRAAYCSANNV